MMEAVLVPIPVIVLVLLITAVAVYAWDKIKDNPTAITSVLFVAGFTLASFGGGELIAKHTGDRAHNYNHLINLAANKEATPEKMKMVIDYAEQRERFHHNKEDASLGVPVPFAFTIIGIGLSLCLVAVARSAP